LSYDENSVLDTLEEVSKNVVNTSAIKLREHFFKLRLRQSL
jgi:hypothetical protein